MVEAEWMSRNGAPAPVRMGGCWCFGDGGDREETNEVTGVAMRTMGEGRPTAGSSA